jgi:hypothetical protein
VSKVHVLHGHQNLDDMLMVNVVRHVFLMNEMLEHQHVLQNGVVSHGFDEKFILFDQS